MKKFITITLVLIMALSLFACGEDKSNKDKSPEDAVTFSASDPKDDAIDNAESSIPESTITNYGADFSYLLCQYNVTNNY